MTATDHAPAIERFLAELHAAVKRDDRGMLADLRHGFTEATAHLSWRHLAPYCDLRDRGQRAIWTLLGAGYATLAPDGLARPNVGNVGATMRDLVLKDGKREDKNKKDKTLASFDGRFRRLLVCRDVLELCSLLPGVVRAAKAKRVPMDFRKLYEDLIAWDVRDSDQDVRVEWATAYWDVEKIQRGARHEGDGT